MWDGNSGTNIASHQSHKADVLSVCLDELQTTVYATGNRLHSCFSLTIGKEVRVDLGFGLVWELI